MTDVIGFMNKEQDFVSIATMISAEETSDAVLDFLRWVLKGIDEAAEPPGESQQQQQDQPINTCSR